MALDAGTIALQMRKVKLAPAHAVADDAVVHFFGVLKSVGQGIVQAIFIVDAHIWAPFFARGFFGH